MMLFINLSCMQAVCPLLGMSNSAQALDAEHVGI